MIELSRLVHGNYAGVVPPDPIPNSEVKCAEADDSGFPRK